MATAIIAAALVFGALYRLRGGWFSNLARRYGWEWGGKQRSQTMRALWAGPFSLLVYACTGGEWWMLPALFVSAFASLALWGHGAHMVHDTKQFIAFSKNKTELLTTFWPDLFGGLPDATWPAVKVHLYNISGMGWIGLVRNTTAMLPVFFVDPVGAAIYAASGALHGVWYWLGWRISDSTASEVIVGAVSGASVVVIFGGSIA
jgi:hypothetical protein